MDARSLKESQLASHLGEFADQLGLSIIRREVPLGRYRLDALAEDADGEVVVVELKTAATKDTIGQLLLYPRALRTVLLKQGYTRRVRSLLIATHLDSNVVGVVDELRSIADVSLKVCVGTEADGLRLVDPADAPPEQVWDQSAEGKQCVLRVIDGKVRA
jgi:hypothetical protein